MRCEDVQGHLPNYADGEIPPKERRAIEAHLRGCPICRAALGEVDSVAAMVVQSKAPPLPPGFAEQVMSRARYRITRQRVAWSPIQWWRTVSAPLRGAAAAVLVLGLLGGWAMGRAALGAKGSRPAGLAPSRDALDGYNVDYLDDAPQDSLAGSYLALVSHRDEEGR